MGPVRLLDRPARRALARRLLAAAAAIAWLGASDARASTGVCDSNPPASTDACAAEIQASGGVNNAIFQDANGRTGDQLPLFGKVVNTYPGCAELNCAGCNPGTSTPPYDCPGLYACTAGTCTLATLSTGLNALDHLWGHPCRLADHALDANGCPNFHSCIADGVGGAYLPWEGIVFDLGGPSNKVAIFAQNDHGPQPCESLEYTVYLTDDPTSRDVITQPTTQGADPHKWNRAVLSGIYTWGWFSTRGPDPSGHAACGDTSDYAVEDDSFTQVFALPCGITFRYAAVIAGNDGLDFPACAYDSSEAELDAVAGLTESGAGVCPDADVDGFVDCACPGAPQVCDCDDANPAVHPGAPERCDDPDLDCDSAPGACATGTCLASVCVPPCKKAGEFTSCSPGSACTATDLGLLCVPKDCTVGGCPAGSVCDDVAHLCKPACEGVVCPFGQTCRDGACVDPCAHVVCPNAATCVGGACKPRCDCFAGDVGCGAGEACDRGATDLCVPAPCVGVMCTGGLHCDAAGGCVGLCAGAACPSGQRCDDVAGCVPHCTGVTCADRQTCDPADGVCKDDACNCLPGYVCKDGGCVVPDGGLGDGGSAGGASGGGSHISSAGEGAPSNGGCGCRAAANRGAGGASIAALALLLFSRTRRRRGR